LLPIAYLLLNASYYKVPIDGVVHDCTMLITHGILREEGKRMIVGISCALSEPKAH
jgi:transposase-like protein